MGEIVRRFGGTGLFVMAVLGLLFPGCGGVQEAEEIAALPEATAAVVSEAGERAVVAQLAHDFMQALSTGDTVTLARLLAPQAMLYSIREGEDGAVLGARTGESFLEGIGGDSRDLLERIWEPVVEVSGRVAMVWAPYDFHLDGAFSHCGIDVLTLLKLEEGWKVVSITYNVVREGCAPSPLGEPIG